MNREQRRAQARATARVQRAAADPVAAADEITSLRSATRVADLVIHSLLKRYVGFGMEVTIPYAEWNAQPPKEKMYARMDDDGNITVVVGLKSEPPPDKGTKADGQPATEPEQPASV
jgi:hypothetical protein